MDSSVETLENALREAMLRSDVATLDRLIDEHLLFVGPNGGLYRKADDLAAHRSGTQRLTRLDLRERVVAVHGDTVIVSVIADLEGSAGGIPFAGTYRYLRTWLRTDHGFRIVAGSVTPLA